MVPSLYKFNNFNLEYICRVENNLYINDLPDYLNYYSKNSKINLFNINHQRVLPSCDSYHIIFFSNNY